MKYLNDLLDLEDILDNLNFEDEPTIFDEKNTLDLIETALYLMEDYMNENPTAISEQYFEEDLLEDIKEIFYIQFEEEIMNSEWIEDDLNELLEEAFSIFITTFNPERSININSENNYQYQYHSQNQDIDCLENISSYQINSHKNNLILEKIEHIKQKPQPTQRTDEWYNFRHDLITASNAYKAFESQSTINQLIYEKCQPIKSKEEEKNKMVNINTTFHWGQKYEPLSVMLYENMYNTKVADFGCIQHDQYKFLGASPDGINVDINSERFGRMLEIKNIVNREINGIPKKEYWIQMQLQMEVCDLDECDFLETKFIEYENSFDFFKDIETDLELQKPVLDGKGVILYFHNNEESKPHYIYKPLNIINKDDILKWEEEMIDLYQSQQYNFLYIKSIYWKLEKISCVLVLRNQLWFKNNIQSIENIWNIIEKERVTGYEHRAPNKKNKINKENIKTLDSFFDSNNKQQGCLIKII